MKYLSILILSICLNACGTYGKLYLDHNYVKEHKTAQEPTPPSKNLQPMARGLV